MFGRCRARTLIMFVESIGEHESRPTRTQKFQETGAERPLRHAPCATPQR